MAWPSVTAQPSGTRVLLGMHHRHALTPQAQTKRPGSIMFDMQHQAVPTADAYMPYDAAALHPAALAMADSRTNLPMVWRDANVMSGVFAAGTVIDTPNGKVAIETLATGDLISSFKNGKIAVQGCLPVPDQCIPDHVVRIRSGYLNAKADLITLPHQPVRLDHWLGAALFGTKFPFVTINEVRLDGKIEYASKTDLQFFRLFFGVCDAITANGALCITDSPGFGSRLNHQSSYRNFDYRNLNSTEIYQALGAGGFFRRAKCKS